jgi:hypothetical protein
MPVLQHTEKGLLSQVLSQWAVTSQQLEKIAGQRAMVPLYKELEGGRLASIQQQDEFGITQLIQG